MSHSDDHDKYCRSWNIEKLRRLSESNELLKPRAVYKALLNEVCRCCQHIQPQNTQAQSSSSTILLRRNMSIPVAIWGAVPAVAREVIKLLSPTYDGLPPHLLWYS